MSKPSPAFQFYANDFVTGTTSMTTTEVGGYILLLCEQWDKGGIPGDSMKKITQIMRCSPNSARSIWASIQDKFARGDDALWRNARLEEVRSNQEQYRAKQAANGAGGGRPAGKPNGKPKASHGEAKPNPEITSSSPISILHTNESKNDSLVIHGHNDVLAEHQRLFLETYAHKPVYDGAKDAATAKRLLQKHGYEGACALIQAYFASRDPCIAKSGHGMGPLASATVQNKLLAEMSGVAPQGDGRDWAREFIRG
jgi:uncharacterized protein YdaU (DUF1376 family)